MFSKARGNAIITATSGFSFMNYYAFSALFNAATSLLLGFFVFNKNRKGKANIAFALFALSVIIWSIGYYFWQVSKDADSALFFTRLLMAGAVFIPATYLHFVLALINKLESRKKLLISSYLVFFIFFLFNFTPLFINRVEPALNFPFWPKPGIAFHTFLIIWVLSVIYATYLLYKTFHHSIGIIRSQIKYVFLGFAVGFIAGSTNYLLWYGVPVPPVANILGSVYVAGMAYSIIRYRLMDIRIVFQKILTYLIITAFAFGFFYAVTGLNNSLFGGVFTKGAYLLGIPMALFFSIIFYPFQKFIQKLTKHYLFAEVYNTQETISNLTNKLTTIINLSQIIDLVVDTIKTTMRLNRSGVLLIDPTVKPVKYQIAKVVGFDEHNGISLVQDNFLTQYLTKIQKPLVREELDFLSEQAKNKEEKQSFLNLKNHMSKIEASICLPLISQNMLVGIIVLGSKTSGDAYTNEDLNLLTSLSNQASIAITNARYYKEVQDFNKNLQTKVDDQTKDIKLQSEHLQQLLDVKNDFLRVANHQLNTPLSVVRNAFELLSDKTYNTVQAMEAIQNGFERLNSVIGDFLKAYDLEGEKMNMKPEPADIAAIIEKLLPEKQKLKLAVERNLKLSIEKPKFKIPPVFCDAKQIINVISNLLDNAVFYTNKGGVIVSYELLNNDHLKINIQDTGTGITAEDKKTMFQKFVRGKGATQLHPDGSGLGLYIAKKIIEGNNGEINVISQGANKGSTFSFTLPIYKNQKIDQPIRTPLDENVVIFEENN